MRVHPLLHWTEIDIWRYIQREGIPVVPLYFANGEGKRFRSLGEIGITFPIDSHAGSIEAIIDELEITREPERAGRAMDRSEEHTSELQSLMRISYAVFCLKKKNKNTKHTNNH